MLFIVMLFFFWSSKFQSFIHILLQMFWFLKIEVIQQDIRDIQENVQEIRKKHSAILSAPQSGDKMKEELEQFMADVTRSANRVKQSLKGMAFLFLFKVVLSYLSVEYYFPEVDKCLASLIQTEVLVIRNLYQTFLTGFWNLQLHHKQTVGWAGVTLESIQWEQALDLTVFSLFFCLTNKPVWWDLISSKYVTLLWLLSTLIKRH